MNEVAPEDFEEQWLRIKQEITGIQLLWEAVEQMFFRQPLQRGIAQMGADSPLLYSLTQTAMMESLLMRMSRLMDPVASGKGGLQLNLSLALLVEKEAKLNSEFCDLRQIWEVSGLKTVRNKYLSHNDLGRATTQAHSVSIPLSNADMVAMESLATALRKFRRVASQELNCSAYLDESISLQVSRDIDVLNRSLLAGECFYKLLPDHAFLQDALPQIESNSWEGNTPC